MIPKFRAWDKDTKEWQSIRSIGLEGDGSVRYIRCTCESGDAELDEFYFIDNLGVDFELMQSTGLHDKNGKEIFEGDVVLFDSKVYPVEFKNGIFGVNKLMIVNLYIGEMREYQEPLWNMVVDGIEVVGNIHEHPKLLENI